MYDRLFVAVAAVFLLAAVACGTTDHGAPTASSVGDDRPGPVAVNPDRSPLASPVPVSTESSFDGVETHPLAPVFPQIPFRPEMVPTAAPGVEFQFEPRTDSFPADGPRPFVEINWNVPIPVAEEGQRALIELLSRIPDTPESRHELILSDRELWRSLTGFDLPSYEDGKDAYMEAFLTAYGTLNHDGSDPLFYGPGEGPYLFNFLESAQRLNTFDNLGFDHRNVDQTAIAAFNGRDFIEITVGRFDPGLAKRLLAECDCPQPVAVTTYRGLEYWTWTDGPVQDFNRRSSPPVFDRFGRGGHLLITEYGLFRTLHVPLMEQLIDTLTGVNQGLAASNSYVFMADVMGPAGATGIRVQGGELLARDVALPDGEGSLGGHRNSSGPLYTVSKESNKANAMLAPLLLPYEFIAIGYGATDAGLFDLVVIAHDTQSAAVANAYRLADRIVNSNSGDGLPWAVIFSTVEISVSGTNLVARFSGRRSGSFRDSTYSELLFVHEGS